MTAERPSRWQIAVWACLLAISLFLALVDYQSFQLGVYEDDASYVILARSLIEADIYGLTNRIEPVKSQFPFGFPLLLAPIASFFDQPEAMKWLALAATLANSALLFWGWRWLNRSSSNWMGVGVAGLYGVAPLVVVQTRMVMSEAVFLTCSLIALILTERLARQQVSHWWGIPLGLTLILALYIRTLGITLMLTVGAYLVFRHRHTILSRLLPHLMVTGATMVLFLGLVLALTPVNFGDLVPVGYAAQFQDAGPSIADGSSLATRTIANAYAYAFDQTRTLVLPWGTWERYRAIGASLGFPALPAFLGYAAALFVVGGWLHDLRRNGLSAFLCFVLPYGVAITLWPWTLERYLYPLYPQIIFGCLSGIGALGMFLARRWPWQGQQQIAARLVLFGFIALLGLFITRSIAIPNSRDHVGDLRERTAWLHTNTQPDDVVVTEQPEIDYVYSARITAPYPPLTSPEALVSYLERSKASHVLIAPRLTWQPEYNPHYSKRAARMLELLQSLAAEGRVREVYVSEDSMTRVVAVQYQ